MGPGRSSLNPPGSLSEACRRRGGGGGGVGSRDRRGVPSESLPRDRVRGTDEACDDVPDV